MYQYAIPVAANDGREEAIKRKIHFYYTTKHTADKSKHKYTITYSMSLGNALFG